MARGELHAMVREQPLPSRLVEKYLGGGSVSRYVDIVTVDVVGSCVLHDAGDLGDEALVVPCPTEEVKAHLHARSDAPGGDDPPGVDNAGSADTAGGGDVGQPVDGDLAVGAGLDAVGLLAVGGRQPVEEAHLPVRPRAGAHAGQQGGVRQGADVLVQPLVVHLLAGTEPTGDEKGVQGGPVTETVVG